MTAWVIIEPSVVPQAIGFSSFVGTEHSWLPYVLGLPIILAWHWFADQFVIQRILATRNANDARRGTLLGAILIFVGVVLFSLITYYAAPSLLAGTADSTATMWFKGVGSVVFLALLMASLASDFHSAATLFTMDFYRTVYPNSSDASLVLVGRLSTTMIVVLAILAVSTVSLVAPHLIALLQQFQMHVAPPIVAVFLLGMFWKRTSNRGALWGLVLGELFGAFDLTVRYFFSNDRVNDGMLSWLPGLNLFAFGIISLAISSLILVGVSLLTEAPSSETSTYMSILKRKVS
jgi:SSS family solute:Na+ symporter